MSFLLNMLGWGSTIDRAGSYGEIKQPIENETGASVSKQNNGIPHQFTHPDKTEIKSCTKSVLSECRAAVSSVHFIFKSGHWINEWCATVAEK